MQWSEEIESKPLVRLPSFASAGTEGGSLKKQNRTLADASPDPRGQEEALPVALSPTIYL